MSSPLHKDNVRARAPVPSLFTPTDSTHFLTLSEAWDLEQETNMARASEKWRTCVELQLYSDLTDCIERQHRGFNG